MAKTQKQIQDEIRAIAIEQLNHADIFANALEVGAHEYALKVEHSEIGECYVCTKLVVKQWVDTDKKERFDAEWEAEDFAEQQRKKAEDTEKKKLATEKKKLVDQAKRDAAKKKKEEEGE